MNSVSRFGRFSVVFKIVLGIDKEREVFDWIENIYIIIMLIYSLNFFLNWN